jgi:hypothetical protein
MTSPVDVCNMALDNISARFSITSLSPPLPPPNADLCARHYQPKMDALFRAAHWNCARRQVGLTVLKAAQGTPENPNGTTLPIPPVYWQYEYQLPPDCLKARFILPNPPMAAGAGFPVLAGGFGFTPPWLPATGEKFVVMVDNDQNGNPIKVLVTNMEFAQLVYTARIDNPDLWDPHFLLAAAATLGAWLANPIKADKALLNQQIQVASSIVTQARISDGNEGVTDIDHLPDWMRVRGDTGWGRILEPQAWYSWDPLGLPGGGFI